MAKDIPSLHDSSAPFPFLVTFTFGSVASMLVGLNAQRGLVKYGGRKGQSRGKDSVIVSSHGRWGRKHAYVGLLIEEVTEVVGVRSGKAASSPGIWVMGCQAWWFMSPLSILRLLKGLMYIFSVGILLFLLGSNGCSALVFSRNYIHGLGFLGHIWCCSFDGGGQKPDIT